MGGGRRAWKSFLSTTLLKYDGRVIKDTLKEYNWIAFYLSVQAHAIITTIKMMNTAFIPHTSPLHPQATMICVVTIDELAFSEVLINGIVTNPSSTDADSGHEQVSPGSMLQPTAPSWGFPKGLDKSRAKLPAGFANTVAEETRINSSQEEPVTQETRVWKRGREKFISGARSWGQWQA